MSKRERKCREKSEKSKEAIRKRVGKKRKNREEIRLSQGAKNHYQFPE